MAWPGRGWRAGGVTTPDTAQGEVGHYWPEIVPGGDAVLFTIAKGTGAEDMEIAVLDLATGEQEVLLPGSYPRYVPTGHIVYGADGTLYAVPFDLDRLEVTGSPVPLLEDVVTGGAGVAHFSLSADGALVYAAGEAEELKALVPVT